MNSNTQNSQFFIHSPDLHIPIQTLTLNPNPSFTIHNLKRLFFKSNSYPSTLASSSYFTLNGRVLPDNGSLKLIRDFETLTLNLRVCGGGGDGGSTCAESRDCYLNMYAEKKPEKVDPNEQRLSKWLNCAISNEALRKPVVVDLLGNLFNKEVVVGALLDKRMPKAFSHIKRLRDVIDVEMAVIPGSGGPGGSGDGSDRSDRDVKFQCPVTGLEFNGKYKFYALKGCGHVLSVKALREIKTNSCHVCHKEFVESDKIVINGNEEEVNALRESLSLSLREKKVKKGGDGVEGVKVSGTKRGSELKAEKVDGKIETSGKGVKGVEVNGKSEGKRFKAGVLAPPNANKEVYASIFTSSRKSDFKETYSCRSLPLGRN